MLFTFNQVHWPETCTPPKGSIEGEFDPQAGGAGTYVIKFLDADQGDKQLASGTAKSPDGKPVAVKCKHQATGTTSPFKKNVRVQVDGNPPGLAQPICLS